MQFFSKIPPPPYFGLRIEKKHAKKKSLAVGAVGAVGAYKHRSSKLIVLRFFPFNLVVIPCNWK